MWRNNLNEVDDISQEAPGFKVVGPSNTRANSDVAEHWMQRVLALKRIGAARLRVMNSAIFRGKSTCQKKGLSTLSFYLQQYTATAHIAIEPTSY